MHPTGPEAAAAAFAASAPPERFLMLSIVHLLIGITTTTLGIVAFVAQPWGYQFGTGLWIGMCFLWTGITGLSAIKQQTQTRFFLLLALSSVTTLLAIVLVTLSAVGITWDRRILLEQQKQTDFSTTSNSHDGAFLVQCLLLVTAGIELISGTALSMLSSKWLCEHNQGICRSNAVGDADERDPFSMPFHPDALLDLHNALRSVQPTRESSLLNNQRIESASVPSTSTGEGSGLIYMVGPTRSENTFPQPGTVPQVPATPPPSYSTLSLHEEELEEGRAGTPTSAAEPPLRTPYVDPSDTSEFDRNRLHVMRTRSFLRRQRLNQQAPRSSRQAAAPRLSEEDEEADERPPESAMSTIL